MIYRTSSATTTKKLGVILGKELLRGRAAGPFVFALRGELGAGKTTFIQGLAQGMGVRRTLTSPTFLLMRSYPVRHKTLKKLFHIDAYRIRRQRELSTLGLGDIFSDPSHVVVIEWAEKIKKILPRRTVWIVFAHGKKENERTIRL